MPQSKEHILFARLAVQGNNFVNEDPGRCATFIVMICRSFGAWYDNRRSPSYTCKKRWEDGIGRKELAWRGQNGRTMCLTRSPERALTWCFQFVTLTTVDKNVAWLNVAKMKPPNSPCTVHENQSETCFAPAMFKQRPLKPYHDIGRKDRVDNTLLDSLDFNLPFPFLLTAWGTEPTCSRL